MKTKLKNNKFLISLLITFSLFYFGPDQVLAQTTQVDCSTNINFDNKNKIFVLNIDLSLSNRNNIDTIFTSLFPLHISAITTNMNSREFDYSLDKDLQCTNLADNSVLCKGQITYGPGFAAGTEFHVEVYGNNTETCDYISENFLFSECEAMAERCYSNETQICSHGIWQTNKTCRIGVEACYPNDGYASCVPLEDLVSEDQPGTPKPTPNNQNFDDTDISESGPSINALNALNPLHLFTSGEAKDELLGADNYLTPANLINRVLKFLFPLAGMILFVMLLWGGFEILGQAATKKSMDAGRQRITAAILGFLLLFASYWLLQIVELIFGVKIL